MDKMMSVKVFARISLSAALCAALMPLTDLSGAEPSAAERPSDRLSHKGKDGRLWWRELYEEQLDCIRKSNGRFDFVLIGDSITSNWRREDGRSYFGGTRRIGKIVADEFFSGYRWLNAGIGGDGTPQVLWRCLNGILDGYETKVISLMVGTNNRRESAEDVASGIKRIIGVIRKKQPQAKILLNPILPRFPREDDPGDMNAKNEKTNKIIQSYCDGSEIIWLDWRGGLYKNGILDKSLWYDREHPAEGGYRLWAKALMPHVSSLDCPMKSSGIPAWPKATRESKPWVYNWWMGSAVDEEGLEFQCRELAEKGFGGFHVIPIYGAKGYEGKYRKYLSDGWLEAFADAVRIGAKYGLGVDLTTGSGWCFGGPQIDATNGCWKLERRHDGGSPHVQPVLTGQLVKRAGPGAEGLMMDPYSVEAMDAFLRPFSAAFDKSGAARPVRMYHDSFEYFSAGWTPRFFELFKAKRGYDLKDHWDAFAAGKGTPDIVSRLKCDYRETLSDLVIEDVFPKWVEWCHRRGIATRNEAHGSPANWLDFYAIADCPETEMFGKDCRDILISKFASSVAHVTGKPHVSAEACTWLNEHFCETPLDYKRMLDRLLVSGVNRIYYHGLCYSPTNAAWPGWSFYASSQTNPRNPLWRDFGAINGYVTRVQSVMQASRSDNDILVYWPIHDLWSDPAGFERAMTVHRTDWFHSQPIGRLARALYEAGGQFDYVSDRMLKKLKFGEGPYRSILVPGAKTMPLDTAKTLVRLAEEGFRVVFVGGFPESVPGLRDHERQTKELLSLFSSRPKGVRRLEWTEFGDFSACFRLEPFARVAGLSSWRRKAGGVTYYFIVNNSALDVSGDFRTSADVGAAWEMDPVAGEIRGAMTEDGAVRISLAPYGSTLIAVSAGGGSPPLRKIRPKPAAAHAIAGPWTLSAVCGGPVAPPVRTMGVLSSWSELENGDEEPFCGTMLYRTRFPGCGPAGRDAVIDLGKVCHSARVRLNGHDLGCRFMPPYRFDVPKGALKEENEIEVEVTNLGANRIRWNDMNKVCWKYFHNINMVSVKGVWAGGLVPFDASDWPLRESGLLGPVSLCERQGE